VINLTNCTVAYK